MHAAIRRVESPYSFKLLAISPALTLSPEEGRGQGKGRREPKTRRS